MEKERFVDSVKIYYAVRSTKKDKVGISLSLRHWLKISHRGLLCFDPGSRGKRENGQNFTANQASIADPIVLTFKEKGEKNERFIDSVSIHYADRSI